MVINKIMLKCTQGLQPAEARAAQEQNEGPRDYGLPAAELYSGPMMLQAARGDAGGLVEAQVSA